LCAHPKPARGERNRHADGGRRVAIGGELQAGMRGGVWFADLAPLRDANAVVAALALALGIAQSRNASLLESVTAHLRLAQALVILDNCEHVIDEVARVADAILNACPQVKILATSREPLRVAGEARYRLPSLRPADAIELFAERVRGRMPALAFDDEDHRLIAEICARLDGIPLAIELAAARVGVLSVSEVAGNLDRRFAILTDGERTALPRHRTMRALLDWSYDLLDAAEQRLFARLAIFAGGFTLDAVTAVGSPDSGGEAAIFEALASLVDKSLARAQPIERHDVVQRVRPQVRSGKRRSSHRYRLRACASVDLAQNRSRLGRPAKAPCGSDRAAPWRPDVVDLRGFRDARRSRSAYAVRRPRARPPRLRTAAAHSSQRRTAMSTWQVGQSARYSSALAATAGRALESNGSTMPAPATSVRNGAAPPRAQRSM